ncbi:LacI family DNA-binding transcriptional regulator [Sinorhizobium numidicum]|uniref:LacI family DNA-binding transcriptional regulator n=1 Tax=Sinorhizobium numidicum TaxID=680248 RepID=A0ABY8CNR5_9HYPH|nr:LacI family DNA-binding transcriptional regulator [Sinorhizobium numidicum]WEX74315.1 LacI family DNA-binding transcriptional regulator [Sinorhizobium numidicum]WEX80301.1 LacI family DNA-binding transcriptional regulator [Sinorhizobium numidicum]
MVSIKDVARLAGVSDKTVSRVVNKEPNVHADTLQRVEAAIVSLGYVPNMAARLIRSNRSRTFGIITDFISTTPYSGDIVRGIQDWANANGRTVFLANTNGSLERERETWRTFQSHRIDGVLYVTMYHRVIDPESGDVHIPTVLVNCRPGPNRSYVSIEPDDFQGSRDLTKYLLEQGHRRIGYIRLNPRLLGAQLRYEAFREAIRDAGLSEQNLNVRLGMDGQIGEENNYVFAAATEILTQPERPTAIMCGNDEMALQAYIAALSLGLSIPTDVSIVGFDDFRTVSHALKPELTTAALPYYDLGYCSAERLERLLEGEDLDPKHATLPCRLVERGSVGAI